MFYSVLLMCYMMAPPFIYVEDGPTPLVQTETISSLRAERDALKAELNRLKAETVELGWVSNLKAESRPVQWVFYSSPDCVHCKPAKAKIKAYIDTAPGKGWEMSEKDTAQFKVKELTNEEWVKLGKNLPYAELFVRGKVVKTRSHAELSPVDMVNEYLEAVKKLNNAATSGEEYHSHKCPYDGTIWAHSGKESNVSHNCPTCGREQLVVHEVFASTVTEDKVAGMVVSTLPVKAQVSSMLAALQPFLDGGTLELAYTPRPGVVKEFLTIKKGNAGIKIPAKTSVKLEMKNGNLDIVFGQPPVQLMLGPVERSVQKIEATPNRISVRLPWMLDPEFDLN